MSCSLKDYTGKQERRLRRRRRVRRRVFGTAEKPRLTVYRSHKNIFCQLVDDERGVTIAAASTLEKGAASERPASGGKVAAASVVGKLIAQKALALGITAIQFDRNGYQFHGRVKALAEAARQGGLKF
jgi:large subunit ribosomal protein L18